MLIDDIVREFFGRVGWITIPILLSLLVIDVSIFRKALSPLLKASDMAEEIGPERTDVRLPLEEMPSEIRPLVDTINQALERLERGFLVQRDFTADAAHELRTPLSILQARIDTIPDKAIAKELSRDIARMKRIVSQLLDMAELEAFSVGPGDSADLKAVCVDVAEFVAPLAVAEGKQILLEAPETPVPVNGNAEVLFRAVRNIAENAIRHTPKGGTVTIAVRPEGAVSVADEGPGIPLSEREQIFQRFWRKDRRGSSGTGLGLSIVRRIMDAHRGEINISNEERRRMRLHAQAAPGARFPAARRDAERKGWLPVAGRGKRGLRFEPRRQGMSGGWKYQIRIDLPEKLAEMARNDPSDPALTPLPELLAKHGAALKCVYDAFAEYVAEAEKLGEADSPLYRWTKATIEDPAKKQKYLKSFTLHVAGREVYDREIADALEADLQPLVGAGLIARMYKHDTNPANNPQAPARFG